MISTFLFGLDTGYSLLTNVGFAILRVFAGLAMAFGHGFEKIPPSETVVEGIGQLGFPVPLLSSWMAALAEFVGGLLLALGLLTRPAAMVIGSTMIVAAFVALAGDSFEVRELALFYLVTALFFMVCGAGDLSLDRLARRLSLFIYHEKQ